MSERRVIILRDEILRRRAIQVVTSLDLSQPYDLTLAIHQKNRSLAQNRLLHVWMRQISKVYCETTGICKPPRVWKEFFKQQFLGQDSFEFMGRIQSYTRHTSDLGVKEFTVFLDQIDHFCAEELHIVLGRSQFYEEAMGK